MVIAKLFVTTAKLQYQRRKNPKAFGTITLLEYLQLNHKSEYSSLEVTEQAREMKYKDNTSSDIVKTLDNHVQKVTPFGVNHLAKLSLK